MRTLSWQLRAVIQTYLARHPDMTTAELQGAAEAALNRDVSLRTIQRELERI